MSMDVLSSLSPSQIGTRTANAVTKCALMFMETAAQLSIGQTLFRLLDRFLWVVEKSAQWSLPTEELNAEVDGNTFDKIELVRPLPWIFFLTGLILLRLSRIGLNIGSLIFGYPRIEAAGMVKFLQKVRKRLRNIKTNGMRNMRQRKSYAKDDDSSTNNYKWRSAEFLKTIQSTLSSLSCLDNSKLSPSPPPIRIEVRANHDSPPTLEQRSTIESSITPINEESKRKCSQLSTDEHPSEDSEEETIQTKIDRLVASNNSTEDIEYMPGDSTSLEDDSTSISDESSISVNEIRAIQDEANLILHRALAGVTEVIKEEPEPIKLTFVKQSPGMDEKFVTTSTDCTTGNCKKYYSPCKFNEDGETAFYSPISSTSPSPDRMLSNLKQEQQDCSIQHTIETINSCSNGKQNVSTEPQISGNTDKTTNGHADEKRKVPTNVSSKNVKSHHRGKRANQSSRKKK